MTKREIVEKIGALDNKIKLLKDKKNTEREEDLNKFNLLMDYLGLHFEEEAYIEKIMQHRVLKYFPSTGIDEEIKIPKIRLKIVKNKESKNK